MLNDQKPEYWIEIANHDIDTVNILLKESGHPDIIIYHIHQAIEKLLKAEILKQNKEIIFIHDLKRLLAIIMEEDASFAEIEENIIIIQSYNKNLRYPQAEVITNNDLTEAFNSFIKVLNFLKINFK